MYYVYLLKLNNNTVYTGFTKNLKTRLKEHSNGKSSHTSKFRPVKLIGYYTFITKLKALKFELYLKTGSGIAFRNKHLI